MHRLVFGTLDLPDTDLAPRLLDRFYTRGGRALDVANVYRDGESARAVGGWLSARDPDGVVLYAKGCHPPHNSPDAVPSEIDKACGMLSVDRIDVFILHRDDPALPVVAWADPLLEQVAAERIGAFGVSNWTLPRVRQLRDHLEQAGADHLRAYSNHFSLAEMVSAPWDGCLATSKEELHGLADADVEFLAWSSLATGFFAGRDTPSFDSPENRARRDRAAQLGGQLGVSAASVALAYVFSQPDYVMPCVGTRSEEHLDEAVAAADVRLDAEQVRWLETGD
jgi:aryl-alcohol dehydrogenase-like predicted oxidoreductase